MRFKNCIERQFGFKKFYNSLVNVPNYSESFGIILGKNCYKWDLGCQHTQLMYFGFEISHCEFFDKLQIHQIRYKNIK